MRLFDADVVRVRSEYAAGASVRSLAAQFGLSVSSAYQIIRGDRWKHVEGAVSAEVAHYARGERANKSHLTESDIRMIRELYALGGATQKDLAVRFGVSQPLIGKIVRRLAWAHVN